VAVSTVSTIDVLGGLFSFGASPSGIGDGPSGPNSVGNVTVWNGSFDCSHLTSGSCFEASSLTFAGGAAHVITNRQTVGTSLQTEILGSPELYFQYISQSVPEGLKSLPLLHLESIPFPNSTAYTLTIREIGGPDQECEREIQFDRNRSRGFAISVPHPGNYAIFFRSILPSFDGQLTHDGCAIFAVSGFFDNFYSNVSWYVPPTHFFTRSLLRLRNRRFGTIVKFALFSFRSP
jgi:hypothetical protein